MSHDQRVPTGEVDTENGKQGKGLEAVLHHALQAGGIAFAAVL